MALLPAEDEERGGRSDVTNSACAEEAKGGGLDPMALSAPPLCHPHQMTRGEWQLHANSGGRGSPGRGWQLL